MNKIFYEHLVLIEEVFIELDAFEIDEEEKQELKKLIDETLHNHTLNVILTHLPKDHHETFLSMFHENPFNQQIWAFLKEKIDSEIEEEIKKQADKMKKEILADIRKSKKKR